MANAEFNYVPYILSHRARLAQGENQHLWLAAASTASENCRTILLIVLLVHFALCASAKFPALERGVCVFASRLL